MEIFPYSQKSPFFAEMILVKYGYQNIFTKEGAFYVISPQTWSV